MGVGAISGSAVSHEVYKLEIVSLLPTDHLELTSEQLFKLREERVSLKFQINKRQVQLVSFIKERCIHSCAADDEDPFLILECCESSICGSIAFDAGDWIGGEDDVSAVGERLAERFPSLPSHEHGVTCRESLEPFQIIGDVPGEFAVLADYAVLPNRGNDGDLHTATSNLIGS